VQSDEGEGFAESDAYYGGIGYGGDLRPDLSNTQFAIEAWAESEAEGREQGFARAMTFLQRCQNNPESNDKVIERADGRKIEPGTDGGATYYPGNSKAGLIELENGNFVARSYGSMTYALLKCYLLCGLPDDDPRVKAALRWIQENYTLEYNPGMDKSSDPTARYQGLYYYYFSMAKALDASGLMVLKTPDGQRHVWREELIRHLLHERFREGFWSNDRSSRWWEELPALATSYTLVALDHCYGHFEK
jgi:squalene-hopene/tetraprenyl-beta-curcumene cyclase